MNFRIRDHVAKQGESVTVRVEELTEELENIGLGDFALELRHMPKKRMEALSKKHTKRVRGRGVGGQVEKLNRKRFFRDFVQECIIGWENLDVGTLKRLVALQVPEGVTDGTEVNFDVEQAVDLFDVAYHLETAVATFVTEPANFIEDEIEEGEEDELGN